MDGERQLCSWPSAGAGSTIAKWSVGVMVVLAYGSSGCTGSYQMPDVWAEERAKKAAEWEKDEAAFAELNKNAGVVFPQKMLDSMVLLRPGILDNEDLTVLRLLGRLKRVVDGDDMMKMGKWSKHREFEVYSVGIRGPDRSSTFTLKYYPQRGMTWLAGGLQWGSMLRLLD